MYHLFWNEIFIKFILWIEIQIGAEDMTCFVLETINFTEWWTYMQTTFQLTPNYHKSWGGVSFPFPFYSIIVKKYGW